MSDTEEWDANLTRIGSRDHVHAVGAFALYYNALEMALYGFFTRYAPGDAVVHGHLFGTMNNRQRIDFIKLMARHREDKPGADAVEYATKLFDLCAENRNLILHAIPGWKSGEEFTFLKASAGLHGYLAIYGYSVEQIRAAAIAADSTESHIYALLNALVARETWNALKPESQPGLPKRPALPSKLSLSRRSGDLSIVPPPPEQRQG